MICFNNEVNLFKSNNIVFNIIQLILIIKIYRTIDNLSIVINNNNNVFFIYHKIYKSILFVILFYIKSFNIVIDIDRIYFYEIQLK